MKYVKDIIYCPCYVRIIDQNDRLYISLSLSYSLFPSLFNSNNDYLFIHFYLPVGSCFISYTVKTALVYIQIIYLYKEGPHTVRNKGD